MDRMDQTKDAYNRIADIYDKELWDDHPYDKQIDRFMDMVSGKDILDIGCAVGSFTKYVADKDYNVDGIDFSEKMIEIARRKVNNANFYVMDMLDMQLDKKYDGVMAINSTIHIEKNKMQKLFEEIYNILKDAGVFFVILQEGNGEKMAAEPFDDTLSELVSFYTVPEIESLFEQCHFNIIGKDKIRDEAEFELGNDQLVYYLKKR